MPLGIGCGCRSSAKTPSSRGRKRRRRLLISKRPDRVQAGSPSSGQVTREDGHEDEKDRGREQRQGMLVGEAEEHAGNETRGGEITTMASTLIVPISNRVKTQPLLTLPRMKIALCFKFKSPPALG